MRKTFTLGAAMLSLIAPDAIAAPRMATWFRDYGSALGPALAFLFGVFALYIKDRFDSRQRHRRSRRLLTQFVGLALADLPRLIPLPPESGYPRADAARGNYQNLTRYYADLLSAKSFLDANEKQIVEDAPLEVVQRLYQCKWRFDRLAALTKQRLDEEGPVDASMLEEIQSFHESLKEVAGSP
jgi:hypothetical protein